MPKEVAIKMADTDLNEEEFYNTIDEFDVVLENILDTPPESASEAEAEEEEEGAVGYDVNLQQSKFDQKYFEYMAKEVAMNRFLLGLDLASNDNVYSRAGLSSSRSENLLIAHCNRPWMGSTLSIPESSNARAIIEDRVFCNFLKAQSISFSDLAEFLREKLLQPDGNDIAQAINPDEREAESFEANIFGPEQRDVVPLSNEEDIDLGTYTYGVMNLGDGVDMESTKRAIVIDGNDVAAVYGHDAKPSIRGIILVYNYFRGRHFNVKVVIPYLIYDKMNKQNPLAINILYTEGALILTSIPPYDPTGSITKSYAGFIFELIRKWDAVVVSNDFFPWTLEEPDVVRKVVGTRFISYLFVGDLVILPYDPYGQNGPELNEMLYRE